MVLWGGSAVPAALGLRHLLSSRLVVGGVHLGHGREEAVTSAPCSASDTSRVVWQGNGLIKPMCSSQ